MLLHNYQLYFYNFLLYHPYLLPAQQHLAGSLKKLLTILLMIFLAGQAGGLFLVKIQEISFVNNAEEKHENNSEEKTDKEFTAHISALASTNTGKKSFGLFFLFHYLHPVKDQLTPPPDNHSLS